MTGIKVIILLALVAVALDANGNPAAKRKQIKTDDLRNPHYQTANKPIWRPKH